MSKSNRRRRRMMTVAGLVLLAIFLVVPTTRAFEGRGGDIVVIEAGEVIDDDLYASAGEFTLDGTVRGDLVVVGGSIEINGTVEGDLIAAGQSVFINGTVEDDARIAGYGLLLGGEVADDLIALGFSLENEDGSSVGGDLLFAGYQALLAGDVARDVDLSGGAVKIVGSVGGDVEVDVGGAEPEVGMPPGFPFAPGLPPVPSVPPSLTVDEGASIGGNLTYTANAEAAIPPDAVAGDTAFTRVPPVESGAEAPAPSPAARAGLWFLGQLRRLVTLLLVGGLMMWLVPDWTRKVASIVHTRPLPSLGWGVVAIAAFGLVMLVLISATVLLAVFFGILTLGGLVGRFVVLGGLALGTTSFGFSLVWAYVTRIIIGLLLGQLILGLFKSPAAEHRWWPMLLGVLIFVLIAAIPILGGLATLVTVLLGLGALWLWGRDWLRGRKAAPVTVEAEAPETSPSTE